MKMVEASLTYALLAVTVLNLVAIAVVLFVLLRRGGGGGQVGEKITKLNLAKLRPGQEARSIDSFTKTVYTDNATRIYSI